MPEISPQSLLHAVRHGQSPPRGAAHSAWVAHYASAAHGGTAHAGAHHVGEDDELSEKKYPRIPPRGVHAGALGYISDADLAKYDAKVMTEAAVVDTAVAKCPQLSPADQQAWQGTYAAWQAQHDKIQQALASSILGLGDSQMYSDLQTIEGQILTMRDQIRAVCPDAIPSSMDPWSVIGFVAVAAAVVAGLWFLSPVALALIAKHRGSRSLLPPHHEERHG